jgi:hypothetical protein
VSAPLTHLAVKTVDDGIVLACQSAAEARHPTRWALSPRVFFREGGAQYTWLRSPTFVTCPRCRAASTAKHAAVVSTPPPESAPTPPRKPGRPRGRPRTEDT